MPKPESPTAQDQKQDALIDLAYANGYNAGWNEALRGDNTQAGAPYIAMQNRVTEVHKILFGSGS